MSCTPRTPTIALIAAALIAPAASAQVVTPPVTPPERAPAFRPQPPAPRVQPRPAAPKTPEVDFVPITERDNDGKIVMLDTPPEYLALANNPLVDLPTLVRIAPGLYERRVKVERLVADQIDLLLDVENGLVEEARVADETALRETASRLAVFTANPAISPSITGDLISAGRLRPDIGGVTQNILRAHQQDLTEDAMTTPTTADGATPLDQMMHRVLRMSIGEFEYFFRRLMLDTADYFDAIRPQLDLDEATEAKIAPLASRLGTESDIDRRAALIREIFSHLDTDTRRKAMRLAIGMRPEIDPTGLMDPVPAGATPVELDDETRRDLIFQLIEGGRVDTSAFLE
ncbi:MAG: hypothetical protein ACF8LK_02305 [Phycisphaerales bacterium JB041]